MACGVIGHTFNLLSTLMVSAGLITKCINYKQSNSNFYFILRVG